MTITPTGGAGSSIDGTGRGRITTGVLPDRTPRLPVITSGQHRYPDNVYPGGMQWRTPVELTVPADGDWYVVLDHGGFRGRVHGHVEVVDGDGAVEHETVRVP